MSYTYTYDNTMIKGLKPIVVGKQLSPLPGIFFRESMPWQQEKLYQGKTILGNPYARFIKLTNEIRVTHEIDRNQQLAMRLMGGFIATATTIAIANKFYIGGLTASGHLRLEYRSRTFPSQYRQSLFLHRPDGRCLKQTSNTVSA